MENYLTNTYSTWGQRRGYLILSNTSVFIPLTSGHYSPSYEIQASKTSQQIGSRFGLFHYQQD